MSNQLMGNMLTEHVMERALRDKMKQQQAVQQTQDKKQMQQSPEDFDEDFENDPELNKIMNKMKADRLQQIEQNQKQAKKLDTGEYREIVEEEFLPFVTKNEFVAVHFYHQDFERCKIVDNHLRTIALRFYYLNAEKSPFFIQKLAIQMLPTICLFHNGILKDKIIGFADFGSKDDFDTLQMTRRLVRAKMIKPLNKAEKGFNLKKQGQAEDEDDGQEEEVLDSHPEQQ